MKKNFYLIFFLTFFSGALFLAGDNIVQANYQCSTSGIAYADQATCQSACVQTAGCSANNYWGVCSYYISDPHCGGSGYFSILPGTTDNIAWFDNNCNITEWNNNCGDGDYGYPNSTLLAPGGSEYENAEGATITNTSGNKLTNYSCPLSNANQSAYCAVGLSGNTGWLGKSGGYITSLQFQSNRISNSGNLLTATISETYPWPDWPYGWSSASSYSGSVSVNTADIWGDNDYDTTWVFGSGYGPLSTLKFVGSGNKINITATSIYGYSVSNGSYSPGVPGGVSAVGANFSGSVTIGTPGVPLQYFSMSGSGSALTFGGIDENNSVSSGSLAMSCPTPNYCDANHQCSAPGTCTYVAPPTCSMYFSPSPITAGQNSTAYWSSSNATGASLSCTGPVPGTASVGTSGSWLSQYNSSGTENCTLTVTGAGGTGTCNASLIVNPAIVNGTCGTANGTTSCTAPSANLCSSGTSSIVSGSGPWSWTCTGANGGTTASCSSNIGITGTCGSANGSSYCSAPTLNLCGSGTQSTVTGSGPWSWTCGGTCGTASCSANQSPSINGTCGSANGTPATTEPTTNLCNFGSPSTVTGTGPWSWTCNGTCSGTSASCSTIPNMDWKEVSPN